MIKLNENEIILHGECKVTNGVIPAKAEPITTKNNPNLFLNGKLIVAPSETMGNHHVVEAPNAEFFKINDLFYVKSEEPIHIGCVHENRHDTIELAPGTYEFGSQLEYDPFKARLEKVKD
ncbi:MAG: hypothetical protein HC836_27860 [Richelia sp. RM2_1_2]|nr:hypothetical protein [Richelia sp. RM2_1_2]